MFNISVFIMLHYRSLLCVFNFLYLNVVNGSFHRLNKINPEASE